MLRGYDPDFPFSLMRNICYAMSALAAMGLGLFLGQHSKREVHSRGPHRVLYYVDPMHPASESEKLGSVLDCGMQLQPVHFDEIGTLSRTQNSLPSAPAVNIDSRAQQAFGIQLATAQRTPRAHRLRVLGRVAADQTRIYRVNVAADGFVKEVTDDGVGSYVKKDQRLAVIYSPEFLSIAGGYLSAHERTQGGSKEGSAATQGVAGPQNWADRLRNLGMSDSQIRELTVIRKIPEVVYINSPIDGFILARNISPGEKFDRYTEFYRIADLSHVWILADLFANESQYFRPGVSAQITLPDQKQTFVATVANVLPEVNTATRALQLRLEADNNRFALRPDMFVNVDLPAPTTAALTIPADALLHSEMRDYVYVDRNNGSFELREVETGRYSGDRVEILKGIKEGEQVVASGSFLVNAASRLNEVVHNPPLSRTTNPATSPQDLQCILPADAASALASGSAISYRGAIYYFCSKTCRDKFQQDPARYLATNRRRGEDD